MEGNGKSPFDEEEKNRQGKSDFIVTRNFVRVLLGPDPVDGLIDSLAIDGKWIHQTKTIATQTMIYICYLTLLTR